MATITRAEQKSETRRRILDAAESVFTEKGITATTAEVASAAGVSHGSVFVHFPTLANLLTALAVRFGTRLGDMLHTLSEGNSVEDFLYAHLSILGEDEDLYLFFLRNRKLLPPDTAADWLAMQSETAFHFAKMMQREIDAGRVKDVPVYFLFNSWMGIVHYYLENRDLFAPEGNVFARRKSELISSYLHLIQKEI